MVSITLTAPAPLPLNTATLTFLLTFLLSSFVLFATVPLQEVNDNVAINTTLIRTLIFLIIFIFSNLCLSLIFSQHLLILASVNLL